MTTHKWSDVKHRRMTSEQIARADRRVAEQVVAIRRAARTSFDDFFDEKMADPNFASSYSVARAKIDKHDRLARRRPAKYTVIYEYGDDGWWTAHIKEVRGVHAQGRSISQARKRVREALLLFADGTGRDVVPLEEVARVRRPLGRSPRNLYVGSRLEDFLAWSGVEGGDRVLLVGQSSSASTVGRRPLIHGATTRRLLVMMGVSREHYLRGFDRANILVGYRGPLQSGKGDVFPRGAARRAGAKILRGLRHGSLVVALGRGVACALGASSDVPFFRWRWMVLPGRFRRFADGSRGSVAVLLVVAPHPSGVSRWWNDPKNMKAARSFFKSLVRPER